MVAIMGQINDNTIERLTPMLRYLGAQLQQRWAVETYEDGTRVSVHGEWRDVPMVEPQGDTKGQSDG